MDDHARITFSVQEGKLELEGSEAFVEKQMKRFEDVINTLLTRAPRVVRLSDADPKVRAGNGSTGSLESYPNLFVVSDSGVQITRDVPGKNNADKTVNAALLYLLGTELNGSAAPVLFKSIREVCKSHACLDNTNFASTMKDEKSYFVCAGSGKSQTATLTLPGRKQAQALATRLNAE